MPSGKLWRNGWFSHENPLSRSTKVCWLLLDASLGWILSIRHPKLLSRSTKVCWQLLVASLGMIACSCHLIFSLIEWSLLSAFGSKSQQNSWLYRYELLIRSIKVRCEYLVANLSRIAGAHWYKLFSRLTKVHCEFLVASLIRMAGSHQYLTLVSQLPDHKILLGCEIQVPLMRFSNDKVDITAVKILDYTWL